MQHEISQKPVRNVMEHSPGAIVKNMELTEYQVNFFNTFGYLAIPGMFAPSEMEWIIEEFEISIQECGGGKDHDGTRRTMFGGPIEHRPRLCTLLDDERVKGLIGGVIGKDFNYAGGDGNYYTGDTGWHPDGSWGCLFACKVAFYLDPLTKDTGCLRIIPGSQNPAHFVRAEKIDPNQSEALYGIHPRDFPTSIALESTPGDVVIFNHDTYHAAFGGGTRRRMFTMNCTQHCTTEPDLETLHQYLSVHSAGGYNIETGAGMYFPTMVDTADTERQTHLQQCSDIHDELFPQYARRA